jgi:hypothetical protein
MATNETKGIILIFCTRQIDLNHLFVFQKKIFFLIYFYQSLSYMDIHLEHVEQRNLSNSVSISW